MHLPVPVPVPAVELVQLFVSVRLALLVLVPALVFLLLPQTLRHDTKGTVPLSGCKFYLCTCSYFILQYNLDRLTCITIVSNLSIKINAQQNKPRLKPREKV